MINNRESENQVYKGSSNKIYKAIIGMQMLLSITIGCNTPELKEKMAQDVTIEKNDTATVRILAEKYFQKGVEFAKNEVRSTANTMFIKALKYYEQLKDKKKQQITNKNIATGYYRQRNYPKYLEYINKAIAIAKEIHYEYGLLYANLSLGGYYFSIENQPKKALEEYYLPGREKVQKIKNEEDKKELSILCAVDIGNCYQTLQQYDKAEEYRNIARKIDKELNNKPTSAFIYYNKGVTKQDQGHYKEAEICYHKGLELSFKTNEKNIIKIGYTYLANLYETMHNYKKAYEYRTKELNIMQEISDNESTEMQIKLEASIRDKELIKQDAEIKLQQTTIEKQSEQKKKILRTAILSLIAALGAGTATVVTIKNKNKLNNQKKEIEQQKKIIEEAHYNIQESIEAGKNVQETIVLPDAEEIKKIFPESTIVFHPKDKVSGDFYRFKQTPSGKKLFAAVDCTGHGIPGAFVSFTGKKILDDAIQKGIEEPDKILEYLNEEIINIQNKKALIGDKEENIYSKYGMDIALCSRDETNNTLTYSGAVNPIYIVQDNEQLIQIKEIKPNKSKIGYKFQEKDTTYQKDTLQIDTKKNTLIYLFSDGYQDQFGGPNNKKLKKQEFKKIIEQASKEHFKLPPEKQNIDSIKNFLDEKLAKRKGDNEQTDDILVIIIKL